MAQLKDTIVSGNLRVSDSTLSGTVQLTTLQAPTTAGGTTYGPGTNGQVLKTNGTSSYWGVVDKIGTSTVGGTYLPIYLNAGTPTAITVKNNTSKSAIGWASGAAANASLVTLNSIAYWNGCYSGTSSNLEYCAKGAFGTIITKATTDYSKVSISRDLTSGTKIGTITIDGTGTDLYCQTNTNTDTKVTQTASSTSDFRPIVLGYTHSTTPGDLAPSTAPTDQVYVTSKLYMKPTTGDLYTDGSIIVTTTASGLKLTDTDGNSYAAIWDNSHNLWIGSSQAATAHHVGQTFISSGYDSANSIGYDTIRVSVPNATNDSATNYYALHDGNTSASASIASTATGAYQIGTVTIRNTTTTFYGVNTNTWTAMVGATSSANGTAGYVGVNPPKDGYNTKFWRADGSWAVPTNTTYGLSGAYGGTGNSTWVTTLTAGGSGTTSTVPTASTSVYGITKLSDSTSSTSTALAATANSVKTAYDLANGKSVVTASTSTVSGATTIKSIKIDNTNYNIYDSGNTDTKVNVKLATTTKAYLLATSTTPTSSDQAVTSLADTGVYLSTTAGEIVATNFSGKINNHTVGADVPATAVFTDENVKQSVSSTTDYRPIALGKHTWTTGSIPSTDPTTVTDQIYGTSNLYMKPSTGSVFTKGYFECVVNNAGLWLTDSSSAMFASSFCGSNFWIGAANSSSRAHTGVTYISTGYDTTNSCGYSTIFVSIPNADNSGQLSQNGVFGVLHKGNTSVTQVLSSGTKIATVSLGADSTDLYAPTNTDTKVNVTLATTSKAYLLATTTTPTSSAQAVTSVGDTGVYLTSSAGVLHATTFEGSLNGTITVTETHGDGTTPTTQKTYYVPFMVDKQSTNYIRGNDGIRYATYDGDTTASPKTPGVASLRLGNNKTLDDTGNMRGSLLLFGSGADYVQVLPTTLTAYRTIYFPNESGTIALKTQADTNEMINLLSEGTLIPVDNDFYVSQYVNGGTTTTTYHRRSVLALWQYMKSKMTNGSNVSFSTDSTTKVLTISASDANVTQTATSTDANYEVLFSNTADNTTRTEGARKSSAVTLNPSSGNLTTTGAFVLKEGSYTGTINQNTLTANCTWTFPKHASGIVHIEQRANFYDDTSTVTSTPWQKVASLTTGAASTDRTATFIVAANYSGDVDKKFGIAQCHLRTNGSKVFSSAELTWLYKSPQLFLSDVVLLYKSVSNTSTTIEIWAKSNRRYSGYTFTLLDEHDRKGVISGQWELTTNNGAAGSASLPSGFTSKNSRILSNGTTLFDGTVSSSTVPDPAIPLQYAITNTDYDWQSFSMLIMCIQTGTANSIDEWTNIVIPWQLFCSDITTQYYVPKGISDLSSAAALMRHPTSIGQGIVIDVTRGSWSGSKRVVLIGIQ